MDQQFSAGGVLVKKVAGKLYILCLTTKNNLLTIPKGHVEPGESFEQTAIREVKEEIGLKSVVILCKLGVIRRRGTEHSGEKSLKEITIFMMDGSGYTYKHEENYVWVEFDTAAKAMSHTEEKKFLISNKRVIASHISLYFSRLQLILDYDKYPWQADSISKDVTLLKQAEPCFNNDSTVVVAGIPSDFEIQKFSTAAKTLYIPPVAWNNNAISKRISNQISLTPRTLDNLIDTDLPDQISLFYARLSLNLSDTKTFFLINQILKKMYVRAKIFIEGRGKRDSVITQGKIIGPHLICNSKKILRIWTVDFVNKNLIKKLGLRLISYEVNSYNQKNGILESHRFILEKQDKQVF